MPKPSLGSDWRLRQEDEIKKFAVPIFYATTAIAAIVAAYSLPATPPTSGDDVVIVESASDGSDNESEGSDDHAVDPSKAQGPHGKAVSTAAHCPVKGSAHGELVRSIAKDKDATVEDAQKACDEAVEAAAEGETKEKKEKDNGKPEDAGKPDDAGSDVEKTKPTKPKDEVEESTETEETTEDSDESGSSNSPAGGPPPDKGNPNKP
jgi:hypothetical protein